MSEASGDDVGGGGTVGSFGPGSGSTRRGLSLTTGDEVQYLELRDGMSRASIGSLRYI